MKLCSFEGCEKKHCAQGLCSTHWAQQNRHGILNNIKTSETAEERFNRNVKKDESTNCWIWLGAGSGKFYNKEDGSGGYGMLRIQGESYMAHRWAYEQKNKINLTSEDTLDHLCRNTRCVNPDHLEKVTLRENINIVKVLIESNANWNLKDNLDNDFLAYLQLNDKNKIIDEYPKQYKKYLTIQNSEKFNI